MAYLSESGQNAAQQTAVSSSSTATGYKVETTVVDKRASTAAQLQLKAVMDTSPRHDNLRNLKQLMANRAATATKPAQRLENEGLMQGKISSNDAVQLHTESNLQNRSRPALQMKGAAVDANVNLTTETNVAKEKPITKGVGVLQGAVKKNIANWGLSSSNQLSVNPTTILQRKVSSVKGGWESDALPGQVFNKKKEAEEAEMKAKMGMKAEAKPVAAAAAGGGAAGAGGAAPAAPAAGPQNLVGHSPVGSYLTTIDNANFYRSIVCFTLRDNPGYKEVHVHYRYDGTTRVTMAVGDGGDRRVLASPTLAAQAVEEARSKGLNP